MRFFTRKSEFFLLLLIALTSISNAFAQVVITQPTGGHNVSNDLSSIGTAPGYTSLGNIVITDQVAGDFAIATGNRTIILTRPSSAWQFEAGVGSASFTGPNITSASATVTASTITVTYTISGAVATGNSITISGVRVQSTTKTLGTSLDITRTGGTGVIEGFNTGAVVASLSKVAGAATSLQVLLPGQTNSPTSTGGTAGTVINQVAGATFPIVVNAVDYAYNVATSAPSHSISLSSTNPYPNIGANQNLVAGTTTFNVSLNTAGSTTTTYYPFTATDVTDGSIVQNVSSNFRVLVGGFAKLLVQLPGEILAPGSPTGKTGTPDNRVSNSTTPNINVYGVDAHWNRVTTPTNTIRLTTNDPMGVNPTDKALATNGSAAFTIRLRTIGQVYTITAENINDNTKTLYTTVPVNVVAGPFTKLQVLLPGETSAPFTTSGKTGTPFGGTPPIAGTSFNVMVNAVDANWNVVSTVTDAVTISNVTAAYAASSTLPSNVPLNAGTGTFSVTLNRAATNHALRVTDETDIGKTPISSTTFSVAADTFSKLLVLLPGETHDPGTSTGKTGTPNTAKAGVPFNVTVTAVDAYWNIKNTVTDQIAITTNDAQGSVPATNASLAAGTRTTYSVTLRTFGTATVMANDVTTGGILQGVSSSVNVVSGGFAKLQILLPGEIAAPGTASGKTGAPSQQTAGVPFVITVNAVDAAWNLINTVTDVVGITSNDINALLPANAALVNGTQQFSVSLITAATTRNLVAHDISDGSKTLNTSPNFTLAAAPYAKILVLLPNQNNAPGTATGISGNPVIPTRGTQFVLRVRAVDQYFNLVNGVTNTFNLVKSNPADVVPASSTFTTNNYKSVNVTVNVAGTQTITLTDVSTNFSVVVSIPDPTPASVQTDHFRSVTSGVWGDASTWESSTDGSTNWHAATLTPNSSSNTITIRIGHVVEVLASVTVDQVAVQTGAELIVNVGTLTISNTGTQVDGILTGTNSGVITSTAAALTISSTGKYQHKYTTISGTVPLATWITGAVLEFSSYTSYAGSITNSSQNFSDIIWNCPSQNNAGDGPAIGATFNARDINIITTGTGMMFLGTGSGTSAISRNFTLTEGKVGIMRGTSGTKTINVAGNLTLTDGNLLRGNGAAAINFSGLATQNYVNTGVVMSGAINFAVNSGATVDFGNSIINGTSGTFSIVTGATLITANEDGLAATGSNVGTIQNTGTRTYGAANYTYNGSVAQTVGTGLPTTVNNLTISNAQGVTLPSGTSTYTVNGALTINPSNGFLDLGEHPLAGTFTNSGAGVLRAESNNAFTAGKTWTVGVEYASSSDQAIIPGIYNGLFATSGAGVKTAPSGTLNINGNWNSAGGEIDLTLNNTTLAFGGTSAQTIGDQGTNGGNGIEFHNVTFSGNGAKTLNAGNFSVSSTGTLTMGSGATLNAGGRLTLKSDASSSGSIASIPSNAVINGNVTVQRFITGGPYTQYRTYRMISSPIYDNGNLSNRTYNYLQFKDDMLITGTDGAINGFDDSPTNSPGAWVYKPLAPNTSKFISLSNINTNLSVGKSAYVFYRGDRTNASAKLTPGPGNSFANPESTVMDFEGVLNQQNVVVPLEYAASVDGFNLIGNPYASSIDWNSPGITKTGLADNAIRIWNPANKQYAVYDGITSVPEANGGSNILSAGQGFFVRASNSSSSVTFTESAKVSNQPPVLLMSVPTDDTQFKINKMAATRETTVASSPPSQVRAILKKETSTEGVETAVVFQNGRTENYLSGEDILYLKGQVVFMSSLSKDNNNLVINYMPEIDNNSKVHLNIDAENESGNYSLIIKNKDLPTGYAVKLSDKHLGTSTIIENGAAYNFTIDKSNSATFGVDRFSVSFEPPAALPVTYSSFNVTKVNEGVLVKWSTQTEVNNNRFEIERAGDDKVFVKLHTEIAKGSGAVYTYIDKTPLLGNNYYRLVQVDNDNKSTANQPQVINYTGEINTAKSLNVFPNPVVDNFIVKYNGTLKASQQTLRIVNPTGQVLLTKKVNKAELIAGYNINIASYAIGVYMLEVYEDGDKRLEQVKLIKQ